jgi:hypothetical protein
VEINQFLVNFWGRYEEINLFLVNFVVILTSFWFILAAECGIELIGYAALPPSYSV